MLKGKRVWVEDPQRLKIFYPDYHVLEDVPLFSNGKVIINGGTDSPLNVYTNSIWVVRNAELNLENVETLKSLFNYFKTFPEKYEFIWSLSKDEIWKFIQEFFFLGYSISFSPETQGSVYELFKSLGSSDKDIYSAFVKVNMPIKVIASSILTMLLKMQNREEFQGIVNKYYMLDMSRLSKRLTDIRKKFLAYLDSEREESDLLNTFFMLRK